jgi:hypothetical protein
MAEDSIEGRERTWRSLLPWTELFRGFHLALDPGKLLLAAAGILVMAFGWWLLSLIFGALTVGSAVQPAWPGSYISQANGDVEKGWELFRRERSEWNLMHETANAGSVPDDEPLKWRVEDIAATAHEREKVADNKITNGEQYDAWVRKLREDKDPEAAYFADRAPLYAKLDQPKPTPGKLATWPFKEERGPNPYLLVTGQAGEKTWEAGHFWDWLLRKQLPVMIEPLIKFFQPVVYFFDPRATTTAKIYFLLISLWSVATWALFGGAITRIAAVQAARGEKIGMFEALRFTTRRYLSYLLGPIFPLICLGVLVVLMILFGFVFMIPLLGDLLAGLLWGGLLIFGLVMAIVLVGLVSWPLMSATVSAEGTDSWEAVSRSYSYLYQRPWHYIWYSLVAIAYGAVLVFFVGFMGSLTAYLSKWGVAQTPGIQRVDRDPAFLFAFAPQSFGWRPLLMHGATVNGADVVQDGQVLRNRYQEYLGTFRWYNYIGAGLMAIWLGLLFLLVLGFGYSYFWSAGTIIYLLMRRNVDAAELDEVYLEEEEHEGPYTPAPAPEAKSAASLPMVESPTLRSVTPEPAPAAAPYPSAPPPAAVTPAPAPAEVAPAPPPPQPAPPAEPAAAPRTDHEPPGTSSQ